MFVHDVAVLFTAQDGPAKSRPLRPPGSQHDGATDATPRRPTWSDRAGRRGLVSVRALPKAVAVWPTISAEPGQRPAAIAEQAAGGVDDLISDRAGQTTFAEATSPVASTADPTYSNDGSTAPRPGRVDTAALLVDSAPTFSAGPPNAQG
jgi:hypothetical protein